MYSYGASQHQGLFRNDDPGYGIGNQADACHERCDQPNQPDRGHVDIKVFGEPEADACDLASLTRPHQPLASDGRTPAGAPISTNIGVILNHFTAVVAVHISTL